MRNWLMRHLKSVVSNAFHILYYHSKESWPKNTFLGYPLLQNPFDLQTYQELIFRTKPSCIVQTGIANGGSLLYFASLFDLMHAPADAKVIGVDIQLSPTARTLSHPRIHMIEGDSVAPTTLDRIKGLIPSSGVMVVLDSDHTKGHVLRELQRYSDLVTPGLYLVVEDTNINGHPVYRSFGEGPLEAVDAFLTTDDRFVQDEALWQRQFFSHHQHGWLRRVK